LFCFGFNWYGPLRPPALFSRSPTCAFFLSLSYPRSPRPLGGYAHSPSLDTASSPHNAIPSGEFRRCCLLWVLSPFDGPPPYVATSVFYRSRRPPVSIRSVPPPLVIPLSDFLPPIFVQATFLFQNELFFNFFPTFPSFFSHPSTFLSQVNAIEPCLAPRSRLSPSSFFGILMPRPSQPARFFFLQWC